MTLRFHHAIITGACGGLGQALARTLLAQGCTVALVTPFRDGEVDEAILNRVEMAMRAYDP